jgi:hypothetical protein
VVIAAGLMVAFSLAGGLGIIVNNTAAIVVGWVGFAVTALVGYWTAPAGRGGCARSRSPEKS